MDGWIDNCRGSILAQWVTQEIYKDIMCILDCINTRRIKRNRRGTFQHHMAQIPFRCLYLYYNNSGREWAGCFLVILQD